jgi:hypothetical protein
LDTATGELYVTNMSQVVVYAPAERAVAFSLFSLSPSILLGHGHGSAAGQTLFGGLAN